MLWTSLVSQDHLRIPPRQGFDCFIGISIAGKIVIVRYGQLFRGLKIGQAQDRGAVGEMFRKAARSPGRANRAIFLAHVSGVLIYSDPAEDGPITVENGYKAYPDGPARQPSSAQRGSAQFLSVYPGDPLTPFSPSYKNAKRLPRDSPELNIPTIPSLPISYTDALPLLKSLNGKGTNGFPEDLKWKGALGYMGVEYWTGPSDAIVEMENGVHETVTPIW